MQKPIQRLKFTKAIARHTKIRDQILRSDMFAQLILINEMTMLSKFEDRPQEETEWQEQGAREAAWKLSKNVFKLKEHERATFFSRSENRYLPASNHKPEEREFVVDSGASMHKISKKDLSDAEMDTLTKSCSPTIVITANGEVQTNEEATMYFKELGIFLTMKVLVRIDQWSKTTSHQNGIQIPSNGGGTSFLSWFQICQIRPLDLHRLQRHLRDRKVILRHFFSTSSSSPAVSEIQIREREDRI